MRVLVVWCPDWPIVAATADHAVGARQPAAVLEANTVTSCNQAARDDGVRRGMRRRDAQARCPELTLLDANPDRDAREFEPVLAALEEVRPGVAPLRPGLVALRSPGRYYGGEPEAAAVLAERLVALGVRDCRVGIADDLFTAEQAARRAGPQDSLVVPAGGAAGFLAGLPVEVLDDPELTSLLRRLGLHTLGEFARLPAREVGSRFGAYGARVHRLARGDGAAALATREPPPELACQERFEPPLGSVEAVCFSVRRTTERFVAGLGERGLVCTQVRIEAECDAAVASSRVWMHSRWFSAPDLVDRVHWQLRGELRGRDVTAPVGSVRFVPEVVEPAGAHAEGLWGGGADERVERGVAKVQGLVGYSAVVAGVVQGGRSPASRQALVPWGERVAGLRPAARPWPGSLPAPAPTRVFTDPYPADLVGPAGEPIEVGARGEISCAPARFRPFTADREAEGWQPVTGWAGPWPVAEHWWEEGGGQAAARLQVVGADGRAWLLNWAGRWWTEAAYD